MKADTPIKVAPMSPDRRATVPEDGKVEKRITFGDEKDATISPKAEKANSPRERDKSRSRISEYKREKEKDPEPDLASPRATLMKVVSHRKRDRKDKDDSPNSETPASPTVPSMSELATTKRLHELAIRWSEDTEGTISLNDLMEKLKDAGFNDREAISVIFTSLSGKEKEVVVVSESPESEKAEKSESKPESGVKVPLKRFGFALTIALIWISPEESLDSRLIKALDCAAYPFHL